MKKIILILTLAFTVFGAQAQSKVGHINSAALLEQMPEAKQIQDKLEVEQKEWQGILASKEQEIQTKYTTYVEAQETKSKEMLEVMAAELEGMQKQYQELQQKASQALQTKQQEMLAPLYEKVKTAIAEVAKANGYDYVMDSMEGSGLIYMNPSNDLLPLVKTKLGI